MFKVNSNYNNLGGSYLFSEVARGEGYVRLTAFNTHQATSAAIARLSSLKQYLKK